MLDQILLVILMVWLMVLLSTHRFSNFILLLLCLCFLMMIVFTTDPSIKESCS